MCSDGVSMGILASEFRAVYSALVHGQPPPDLPPLPVQYPDFSSWQRQLSEGGDLETQLAYWRRQLAGAPQLLELPIDHPRPSQPSGRGGMVGMTLPTDLTTAIRGLAATCGVTIFMTLLAAWQVCMARSAECGDGATESIHDQYMTTCICLFSIHMLHIVTVLELKLSCSLCMCAGAAGPVQQSRRSSFWHALGESKPP